MQRVSRTRASVLGARVLGKSSSSSSSVFVAAAAASGLSRRLSSSSAVAAAASKGGLVAAVLGLGHMGGPMAVNLSRALAQSGGVVRGFDPDERAVRAAVGAGTGVVGAGSAAEAVDGADVVVTMLPNNAVVTKTYLDAASGVLAVGRLKPNALLVDSSTVSPNVARMVSEAASKAGKVFVDAPVSGGVNGAKQGTLTFMVGARTPADFERAKTSVLQHMGKNIVACGGPGTGQVAKICNNLVLAISMVGVCEASNLGAKLGIDSKVLAGIFNTSTARCWSSDSYNPVPGVGPATVPSSNAYEGGFGSSLMLKDLGLAAEAARDVGAPIPLGAEAHAVYQLLVANGLGKKDFSVVYKFLGGDVGGGTKA